MKQLLIWWLVLLGSVLSVSTIYAQAKPQPSDMIKVCIQFDELPETFHHHVRRSLYGGYAEQSRLFSKDTMVKATFSGTTAIIPGDCQMIDRNVFLEHRTLRLGIGNAYAYHDFPTHHYRYTMRSDNHSSLTAIMYNVKLYYKLDHTRWAYVKDITFTNQRDRTRSQVGDTKNIDLVGDFLPQAVRVLSDYGITAYDTVATFDGKAQLSREQAAKFFVHTYETISSPDTHKNDKVPASCQFRDLGSANPDLQRYITRACTLGLMKGTNQQSFFPYAHLSMVEAMTVLVRMLDPYPQYTGNPWYIPYYNRAMELGLTKYLTQPAKVAEYHYLTRSDLALMLYRVLEMSGRTVTKQPERIIYQTWGLITGTTAPLPRR